MMSQKLPILKAKMIEKALLCLGFSCVRKRGSHKIFRNKEGLGTVVPFHAGQDIDRTLLVSIIREIGMSKEDFIEFMKKL